MAGGCISLRRHDAPIINLPPPLVHFSISVNINECTASASTSIQARTADLCFEDRRKRPSPLLVGSTNVFRTTSGYQYHRCQHLRHSSFSLISGYSCLGKFIIPSPGYQVSPSAGYVVPLSHASTAARRSLTLCFSKDFMAVGYVAVRVATVWRVVSGDQ